MHWEIQSTLYSLGVVYNVVNSVVYSVVYSELDCVVKRAVNMENNANLMTRFEHIFFWAA